MTGLCMDQEVGNDLLFRLTYFLSAPHFLMVREDEVNSDNGHREIVSLRSRSCLSSPTYQKEERIT